MVFDWFGPGQRERRRKVRLDCKHLESRSRRFLQSYLMADEERKPAFYRAVEEGVRALDCGRPSPHNGNVISGSAGAMIALSARVPRGTAGLPAT